MKQHPWYRSPTSSLECPQLSSKLTMALILPILTSCLILLINCSVIKSEVPKTMPTPDNNDPDNVVGFLYNLLTAEKVQNMLDSRNGPSRISIFADPMSPNLGEDTTDQVSKKAFDSEHGFNKFFGKRGFKPYSGKWLNWFKHSEFNFSFNYCLICVKMYL